jgi:hypothetical protein
VRRFDSSRGHLEKLPAKTPIRSRRMTRRTGEGGNRRGNSRRRERRADASLRAAETRRAVDLTPTLGRPRRAEAEIGSCELADGELERGADRDEPPPIAGVGKFPACTAYTHGSRSISSAVWTGLCSSKVADQKLPV